MACVLAIDQGTTNTKAQLIAESGAVVARASRPLTIEFPQPGWVEQDPQEIWQSVREAVAECVAAVPGTDIVGVGISNQRESVLLWDRRTGDPLGPCITWQCRRTSIFCDALRQRGLEPAIRARTGLPIDPLFSASKAAWLLDRADPDRVRAKAGALCIGTVDSWLIWNLTRGMQHATDVTNASRTQLFNLQHVRWDDELLDVFRVPASCLPQVGESSGDFGRTVTQGGIPGNVPIAAAIGDSHAALFGHAAFSGRATKATYGTGSSLMTPLAGDAPAASPHGLASTIAWSVNNTCTYALEGNITNTGATVQWLGECLGDADPVAAVVARAETVTDAAGVYLVPAFAGLGAPYWDADARGAIVGLTRGSNAAHLARAALDSIAHQVCDVFEAMNGGAGASADTALLADGGASRNSRLMQRQADLAGCSVRCDRSGDVSIRGAAWLAGLAVGFWDSLDALAQLPRDTVTFQPVLDPSDRHAARSGWQDAVSRVRSRR